MDLFTGHTALKYFDAKVRSSKITRCHNGKTLLSLISRKPQRFGTSPLHGYISIMSSIVSRSRPKCDRSNMKEVFGRQVWGTFSGFPPHRNRGCLTRRPAASSRARDRSCGASIAEGAQLTVVLTVVVEYIFALQQVPPRMAPTSNATTERVTTRLGVRQQQRATFQSRGGRRSADESERADMFATKGKMNRCSPFSSTRFSATERFVREIQEI